MKTTIDLPDQLLIEAKKHAAEHRTTLRQLVTRGLRRELAEATGEDTEKVPRTIHWVVVDGGLPPELDLTDRERMHDWLSRHQ